MKTYILPKNKILILNALRTPIGLRDGILKNFTAPQLAGEVIKGLIEKTGIDKSKIDEVIMGNAVGGSLGQSPSKQAGHYGGLGFEIENQLVNTACSSGMAAIANGIRSILSGASSVVIAGGMESMTNAPYYVMSHTKKGARIGSVKGYRVFFEPQDPNDAGAYKNILNEMKQAGILDANTYDSLLCPFNKSKFMRDYSIDFAKKRGYTIEQVNVAAKASYEKAISAQESGYFDDEIIPVGDAVKDEIPPREKQEKWLADSNDYCSAYNGPFLADGSCAMIITDEKNANAFGKQPIASITGYARYDTAPQDFVEAPVHAVKALVSELEKNGYPNDFKIAEGNESFGVQIPLFEEEFGKLGIEKLNVHGGCIALGHPLGATGARIITTLIYAMKRYGYKRGIATTCFGGGGAFAFAVEIV